jgi:hypothetical protein
MLSCPGVSFTEKAFYQVKIKISVMSDRVSKVVINAFWLLIALFTLLAIINVFTGFY